MLLIFGVYYVYLFTFFFTLLLRFVTCRAPASGIAEGAFCGAYTRARKTIYICHKKRPFFVIYSIQAERGRQSPYSKGFFVCHCGADLCKKASEKTIKVTKRSKNICTRKFFAVSLQADLAGKRSKEKYITKNGRFL